MESKPKKRISVSSAKAKGRNLQQWTRDQILKNFPSLEKDDVKSTSMGAGGEDVQLSPAARREIPISVECKANKLIATYKFYDQAKENCPAGMEPVVVMKADRRSPLVVLDAVAYFELMRRLKNA
jgi:hypothetical protein